MNCDMWSHSLQFFCVYLLSSFKIRVAASDRKSDGSIFGRKSDPIAKAKAKIFEKSIRFNPIKQYVNLIGLKRIKSNAIFNFFVKSDRIHFYFLSDRKIKTDSDPIRWPSCLKWQHFVQTLFIKIFDEMNMWSENWFYFDLVSQLINLFSKYFDINIKLIINVMFFICHVIMFSDKIKFKFVVLIIFNDWLTIACCVRRDESH